MRRSVEISIIAAAAAVVSSGAAAQPVTPGARRLASMVYDAARHELVLFGGTAPNASGTLEYPNDLWAWNGQAWRRIDAGTGAGPKGREVTHMVYDAGRQRVVLFGGRRRGTDARRPDILSDLWEWDGSGWEQMLPD